jgi:hypothetical protein
MITGHLAISALLHHYTKLDAGPAFIGGMFPDMVDKTLQATSLASSGRTVAHTLLSWVLSSLLVHRVWGGRAGRSWAAGYLAHLLADVGGFVPWFSPFRRYRVPHQPRQRFRFLRTLLSRPSLAELILVSWWLVVTIVRPFSNGQRQTVCQHE